MRSCCSSWRRCCFCEERGGLFAGHDLRRSRPISLFDLARKEKRFFRLAAFALPGPASRRPAKGAAAERRIRLPLPPAAAGSPPKEKRALNALNLCTVTDLGIAIVRYFHLSGRNRGIDWQNQFRAEPLRLALPGCRTRLGASQGVPFSTSLRGAKRRGNPFFFGRPRGSELQRERTVPISPGVSKRGPAVPPCRICPSRACFATARQRRGCGAENPPSSATGSGGFSAPLWPFQLGGF